MIENVKRIRKKALPISPWRDVLMCRT